MKNDSTYSVSLLQAKEEDPPLAQQMQQAAFAALLARYQDHDMSPATETLEKIRWKITQLGRVLPFCKYASEAWCSEAFSFVFLQVFLFLPSCIFRMGMLEYCVACDIFIWR